MKRIIKVEVEIEVEQEMEDEAAISPEYIENITVKIDGKEIPAEKHTFSPVTWTIWDNESGRSLTLEMGDY